MPFALLEGWRRAPGLNACDHRCGAHKDQPGLHFVGLLENATACEATCIAKPSECPIWLYSSGSKACWWRTDGVWSPMPQPDVVSACREAATGALPCVQGCGACPVPPSPPPPMPFSTQPNMNGHYLLSQTPEANDTAHRFPAQYKDYPGGAYSFDVYSPEFSQLYSQVWWSGLPPVDLPDEIVKHFKGKGMAITGFEMDQVRKGAGPGGEDVAVPINAAYNHHFESTMVGANAHFEKVRFDGPDDPRLHAALADSMGHGLPSHEEAWVAVEHDASGSLPSKMAFGGANGGEYRKSYHGYAPGYAQLIESPTQVQITPMQIDTWRAPRGVEPALS